MSQSVLSQFKAVVPRWVRVAAAVLVAVAAFAVLTWIYSSGLSDGVVNRSAKTSPSDVVAIVIASSVGSIFVASWLLALGYVYGDSKRRGMQPWLWTLLVGLTPNLIGFLLYFALRKPLLAPCPNCGAGIAPDQKFCPACGTGQTFGGTVHPPVTPKSGGMPDSQPGLSLKSFTAGFAVWTGIFLSKSMFAYGKHDRLDSAVLFGFAAIGMVLLIIANGRPAAAR